MVRAPCCDKVGLKKGPWTPEEDRILTDYIQSYGHANWRALPKQSGLLRCGKSCRLRWINYLSPDIKRGNFSKEEEEAIINLHQMLGNRWSVIASRLPGRTDNEIKNVWHTHLKKRVINQANHPTTKVESKAIVVQMNPTSVDHQTLEPSSSPESPVQSCSDSSGSGTTSTSMATTGSDGTRTTEEFMDSAQAIDDSFWWEALSMDVSSTMEDYPTMIDSDGSPGDLFSSANSDDINFWLSVFDEAKEPHELAEI